MVLPWRMVLSKRVNQDRPADTKPDLQLEIAHILLIDLVGYSKRLVNEQYERAGFLASTESGGRRAEG